MTSTRTRFDRRTVLKALGLGGLALALPPLESLVDGPFARRHGARAQDPAPPKRLVILHFANGVATVRGAPELWAPDVPGSLFGELGAWQSRVAVVRGLSNDEPSRLDDGTKVGGNPHIHPSAIALSCVRPRLSGTEALGAGGPTIDQIAAREGGAGRVPILVAAAAKRNGDPYFREGRISYTGPNDGEDPITDPAAVWGYLFEGLDPTDAAAQALRDRRRSVLAHLEQSAGRLGSALSSDDRLRVEEHVEALRALRARIDFDAAASCTPPAAPPSSTAYTDARIDTMFDLIARALACDATRVVTFSLTAGGGGPQFGETSLGLDVQDHDCSHLQAGTTPEQHTAVTAWKVQRLPRLLDRLAAIPEADGTTLLDHTRVVFFSEMYAGGGHTLDDLPVIAAGAIDPASAGAILDRPREPLARLWLATLRSLGVGADRVGDFGNAGGAPLAGVWGA